MSSNYVYRTYKLVVTYNSDTQLWEGDCPQLGIKLKDISRAVLSSQFRKEVNARLKEVK